jgi:hypothetical protein
MKQFKKPNAAFVKAAAFWLFPLCIVSPSLASPEPGQRAPVQAISAPASRILARFRMLDMEQSARFNYVDQEGGGVADRGIQYRLRIKPRVDLLGDGTTYLVARAETGRGFNNSWNETAADLYPGQTIFNVKDLGIFQKLGRRAELAVGGIDFDHGEGSDDTYVSHDGYMTGYRALFTEAAPGCPRKFPLLPHSWASSISPISFHAFAWTVPTTFRCLRNKTSLQSSVAPRNWMPLRELSITGMPFDTGMSALSMKQL